MNEIQKELVLKLSKILIGETHNFLINELRRYSTIGDAINLIISTHISSMFTNLIHVSKQDENALKKTKILMEKINELITSLSEVTTIEVH